MDRNSLDMSVEARSLAAFDKLLNEINKDELDSIIKKIGSIAFDGDTIEEYFNNFESHYEELLLPECADTITLERLPESKTKWECVTDPPDERFVEIENVGPEFSRGFLLISHHESADTCVF